jgi:hypothetical protein
VKFPGLTRQSATRTIATAMEELARRRANEVNCWHAAGWRIGRRALYHPATVVPSTDSSTKTKSHRLKICRAQQFGVARHIGCNEAGKFVRRFGNGLDPEIGEPSAFRQVARGLIGSSVEPLHNAARQIARAPTRRTMRRIQAPAYRFRLRSRYRGRGRCVVQRWSPTP